MFYSNIFYKRVDKLKIFSFSQKYLQALKSSENAGLIDATTVDEIFYQVIYIYYICYAM